MSLLFQITYSKENYQDIVINYIDNLRNDEIPVTIDIRYDFLSTDFYNSKGVVEHIMVDQTEIEIDVRIAHACILPLSIKIEENYKSMGINILKTKIESFSGETEWIFVTETVKEISKLIDCKVSLFNDSLPLFEDGNYSDFLMWESSFSINDFRKNELLELRRKMKKDQIVSIKGVNRSFFIGYSTIKKIFKAEDFLNEYYNLIHFIQYPTEEYFVFEKSKISYDLSKDIIIVFIMPTIQRGIVFNEKIDYLLFLDKNIEASSSSLVRVETDKVRQLIPDDFFLDEKSFYIHYGITSIWDKIIKKARAIGTPIIENEFEPLF